MSSSSLRVDDDGDATLDNANATSVYVGDAWYEWWNTLLRPDEYGVNEAAICIMNSSSDIDCSRDRLVEDATMVDLMLSTYI